MLTALPMIVQDASLIKQVSLDSTPSKFMHLPL